MMDAEIEKSAGNIIAMQESSAKLKRHDKYSTLDDVLRTSKSLIQSLKQADALDRWLMLGGLVLFALAVFNILRKRIWILGPSTLFRLIRYLVLSIVGRTGKDCCRGCKRQQPIALVSESVLVTETSQVPADSQLFALDTLSSTQLAEEETPLIEVESQENAQVDGAADKDTQEDDAAADIQENDTVDDTWEDHVADDETQPEEQVDEAPPIVLEEPVVSVDEEPEEPQPVVDQRKIYMLPVERPVRRIVSTAILMNCFCQ
ncbi:hypothetical protein H4R27_004778 [Coemansia aciculifera]|nr:hypothetical protein H4R27_004778 [Coemansia aciculifera]